MVFCFAPVWDSHGKINSNAGAASHDFSSSLPSMAMGPEARRASYRGSGGCANSVAEANKRIHSRMMFD